MPWLIDRKVRLPRTWSNRELAKFASLFSGHIVNVSAWQDLDKEGRRYRDYFSSANQYSITNYLSDAKGFQGSIEGEIFLDLEKDIPVELKGNFDVVFNHTVLEHVFDCGRAFGNLCAMTSDLVILVVPFLQHQHSAYGDFWRFTPEGVSRLFEQNNMELTYINYNDGPNQSIYVFAIASKNPGKWSALKKHPENKLDRLKEKVGYGLVRQGFIFRVADVARRVLLKLRRLSVPDQPR